jgi:hypothetical protein
MKLLGPAEINQVRARVAWCLRAVGLAACALGGFFIVKQIVLGILMSDMVLALRVYEGVGQWHHMSLGLAAIAVGATMGGFSRKLAGWMVVCPPRECPQCGYAGITTEMERCPECGLQGFGGRPF